MIIQNNNDIVKFMSKIKSKKINKDKDNIYNVIEKHIMNKLNTFYKKVYINLIKKEETKLSIFKYVDRIRPIIKCEYFDENHVIYDHKIININNKLIIAEINNKEVKKLDYPIYIVDNIY